MNAEAVARIDELNAGLEAGTIEDVGAAEEMIEAYESWLSGLWSFYTLAEVCGARNG